jgi:hypothetical protein
MTVLPENYSVVSEQQVVTRAIDEDSRRSTMLATSSKT